MRNREPEVFGDESAEGFEELLEDFSPSLIVRHTSRKLGSLGPDEARERLISGSISFSEFADQVGDEFRELLEFMTDNDLHPGRPEEVLYCIERDSRAPDRRTLRSQLERLYSAGRRNHRG